MLQHFTRLSGRFSTSSVSKLKSYKLSKVSFHSSDRFGSATPRKSHFLYRLNVCKQVPSMSKHIASIAACPFGGTGGFFMALGTLGLTSDKRSSYEQVEPKVGSQNSKHFQPCGLVFPNMKSNDKFDRNINKPRSNVLLLGDKAYASLLMSIHDKIGQHGIVVEDGKRRIKAVEGQNDEECNAEREEAQSQVDTAEKALYTLFKDVEKNWATAWHRQPRPRTRGLFPSHPPRCYEYAIIKVDGKIDRTKFNGNAIYLGDEIPSWEFTKKMHPSPKSAPSSSLRIAS
ncbi:hypothetical protein V8E54_013264 [Elaphomyces granulatus]